nr:MAG TPA: NADH-QUINONE OXIDOREDUCTASE SUBUNIT 1 [Caudoviricetes sp.]
MRRNVPSTKYIRRGKGKLWEDVIKSYKCRIMSGS